ncbi:hemolysin-III related-domain-containing protein [Chytriomyces sp. MP71]|nr:hemolysin-III related-domain-containing protein [Chytriomyces sp. MP71]
MVATRRSTTAAAAAQAPRKSSVKNTRLSPKADEEFESDDEAQRTRATRNRRNNKSSRKWWQRGYLSYSSFHEVPRYLQDNPDIHSYYRSGYSYMENWISVIHLHNETFNIWTHYVGFLLFVALAIFVRFIHPSLEEADAITSLIPWAPIPLQPYTIADRNIIAGHLLASSFTFVTSGAFHMHLSHSFEAYTFYGCWDYSGISATVAGSGISTTLYLLACEDTHVRFWVILGVVAVNLVGVVGPIFPFWMTAEFRPVRAAIYVSTAVVTFAPAILHVALGRGVPAWSKNPALSLFLGSCLAYVVGVFFYVSRVPERVFPGKFDLFFASHQIWHFAVVLASYLHVYVLIGLVAWRQEEGSCVTQL